MSDNLEQIHKKALEAALKETGGNRTKASVLLGVSIRTIRNWIRKFDIDIKPTVKTRCGK